MLTWYTGAKSRHLIKLLNTLDFSHIRDQTYNITQSSLALLFKTQYRCIESYGLSIEFIILEDIVSGKCFYCNLIHVIYYCQRWNITLSVVLVREQHLVYMQQRLLYFPFTVEFFKSWQWTGFLQLRLKLRLWQAERGAPLFIEPSDDLNRRGKR